MNPYTSFVLLCFTGGISVNIYGFSQKSRGDRSQMYHLFEKDRYESEAGETPQKL